MKYTDLIATNIDIKEYYDHHIRIFNPNKFKEFKGQNLAVCPLHNDNDPSMGIVFDKRLKSKQRYHCFGCGGNGDIVNLHQEMQKRLHKKSISYQESAKDLAIMYNLEFTEEEIENSNLDYSEELRQSDKKTELILINPLRFTNRHYTKQFVKLTALKSEGGTVKSIAHNLDLLNIKLKESRARDVQ